MQATAEHEVKPHRDRITFFNYSTLTISSNSSMMESNSEQSNDPVSLVRIWQESAEHHDFGDKIGLAARLFQASVDDYTTSLKCAKSNKTIPLPVFKKIKSDFNSFLLWGHGFGATNGDLDALLQTSRELRQSVLSFLILIAQTASKSK